MRRSAFPFAGLILFAACARVPGEAGRAPSTEAPVGAGAEDRRALADAIDPGEQRPLSGGVPSFLLDAIGLPSPMPQDPGELVALASAELEATKTLAPGGDPQASLGLVMGIARAVVLAERAVELGSRDTRTLALLARLYDTLDAPMVANDRALFPQMMQMFVQASAASGHIRDSEGVEAFSKVVFGTLERAGAAHRHTVAELLRTGDDPRAVADALQRVAPKLRIDDDALGVRAMRTSLAMRGAASEPGHWVALADVCYAALDVACGDDALGKAEAGAASLSGEPREALDKSLAATRTRATNAGIVIEKRDARALNDRLQQARALTDLGRHREAEAAYARLRADHPKEAGPVAGLARHAVVSRLDFIGAAQIIEQAGAVEHADAEYYEIAIGCRATALIHDILPRTLAGKGFEEAFVMLEPTLLRLRADIVAYEALGADKGVVVRFLFDVGMLEAVPLVRSGGGLAEGTKILRGILPRALAILDRVPQSVHAYLLVAGSVQFSADSEAAFAALERPLPPDPEHVAAMRRAIAVYELIVTWQREDRLDALLDEVEGLRAALDTPAVKVLEGDVHALAARLREDTSAWAKAEASYRAALGDPSSSTDVRALNNLAVAVAEQGRRAEAIDLWSRAVSVGHEDLSLAKVNLAATRGQPADLGVLAEQESEGDLVEARLLAMAWRAELAPQRERAALSKALRAKVAEEVATQLRPRVLPGTAGIALRGSLSIGVGYATLQGLQLDLTTASQPWLAMRPAALPLDPRASVRTSR